MLNYRLQACEQETTISWTRADTEATIYTSNRMTMTKLDKLCQQYPETYRCVWTDTQILGDGLPMGRKYIMPVKYLRFGKPASEAQRQAGRKSIAKINSKVQEAR